MKTHRWPCGHLGTVAFDGCERCGVSAAEFVCEHGVERCEGCDECADWASSYYAKEAEFDWLTRVTEWATDGRDSRIYTMFCDLDEQHGRHEHLVRGRRCECPGANRERGWVVRLGSYLRIFGKGVATLNGEPNERLIALAKEREAEFGSAVSAKETLGG